MSESPSGHVGRKFYDAIQKLDLQEAADCLAKMVERHLESPQSSEETMHVFLSSHLVSAFDLSGVLNTEQLEPVEDIIRCEMPRLYPDACDRSPRVPTNLCHILQRICKTCGLAISPIAGRMEEVQIYVDEHYAEPTLTVTDLAERFGYSISYLSRTFKKEAGMGLNEYIHQVRNTHAKELLRSTDMPITTIAHDLGFASSSAFIRAYRTAEGITPGAYRDIAQRAAVKKRLNGRLM